MGRDMGEVEEVAEEEQVPLPNSAADPVDDVADDDSDTEELLDIEAPFDQNLCISDDIIKSASPVFEESSVLYEVGTSSTKVSTKIIHGKRNIPRFKRSPARKGKFESDDKHTRHDKYGYNDNPAKKAKFKVTKIRIDDKHFDAFREEAVAMAGRPQPGYATIILSQIFNIRCIDPLMLLEILKCIVYGGLIESIISFSVVASAAATDATTLNVVVIGLATLFSGLIVFGSNLVELRNENSNERYERVLGREEHFALHSACAVLSYLVFGFIAPITYGFAFRESGDKDYKILAVAAAAFGSVFLLSIAKAYASRGRDGYVKTTLCYIMLAVSASGVAYAAGDLIGDVLNTIGMFRDHVPAPGSGWASY